MVITGLRADPRVAGCIIIEADGVRIANLPIEVARELGVTVGTELSPALEERLAREASIEGARRVAVRLLAARPRCTVDLKRRLRDRGHDPEAISVIVERLRQNGLLNDDEFARHYVRVRSARGIGPTRLIHDLLALGVDREMAEHAVRDVSEAEGVDATSTARKLAERRVSQLRELPAAKRRRRLLVYLARRGFQGREVREMVTKLLQ